MIKKIFNVNNHLILLLLLTLTSCQSTSYNTKKIMPDNLVDQTALLYVKNDICYKKDHFTAYDYARYKRAISDTFNHWVYNQDEVNNKVIKYSEMALSAKEDDIKNGCKSVQPILEQQVYIIEKSRQQQQQQQQMRTIQSNNNTTVNCYSNRIGTTTNTTCY